jgi:hypothetical protein
VAVGVAVEARGEAKAAAESVLQVLEARGIVVTEESRLRILSCSDLEVLRSWLKQAAVAVSIEQVIDD